MAKTNKADLLAEQIAALPESARDAIIGMVEMLSDKFNTVEGSADVKLPGRTRKPRDVEEDNEDNDKPARTRKPGKTEAAKPGKTEKPAKPAPKAAAGKSPFESLSAPDFCAKYLVEAKKSQMASAQETILKLLNDKKDYEFYMGRAAKKKIEVKLYKGKPSDNTRKLAAIVALFNAGAL